MTPPAPDDLLGYLTRFAAQEELIRRIVVVRPELDEIAVPGGGASKVAPSIRAPRTDSATGRALQALTHVFAQGKAQLLWFEDGALAVVPIPPMGQGGVLLADTIATVATLGVVLVRLSSLARYIGEGGERPRLPGSRSN